MYTFYDYLKGYEDALEKGISRDACPYTRENEIEMWQRGWDDASREKEKIMKILQKYEC